MHTGSCGEKGRGGGDKSSRTPPFLGEDYPQRLAPVAAQATRGPDTMQPRVLPGGLVDLSVSPHPAADPKCGLCSLSLSSFF